ncbi:hypothetical protein [Oricola cellulosilytica]|uniref:DUF3426 domain-containing protein n=1 Tax=Oricola cellulosilytica TaxID=1429082 RepID=A0A4R0PC76_9HYPH|nr:hypothetical protein [Oricola cellulosilytica]TCD13768.1 hypothetical protein E0D97_11720 [Oricola cellulosilytica]
MAQDFIDAEFVTLQREEADMSAGNASSRDTAATRQRQMGEQITVLKSSALGSRPSLMAERLYLATVVTAALIAFIAAGGHVLLRGAHFAADPSLTLRMGAAGADPRSGRAVTISATISNAGAKAQIVPDIILVFEAIDGGGRLSYRLPRGEMLGAGKSLAFTVRMPKKPGYREAPSLRFDTSGA